MPVDYSAYGTPRLDLGAALKEYLNSQAVFIGTKLFPATPVPRQAAVYPVITRKSLTALADVRRTIRSAYNRTNWNAEDFSYACLEHGLEGQLGAEERKLYKNDFDAEAETTQDILNKLLRAQEIRVAANVSETVFNDSTVFQHCTAVWGTATNKNIIKDVQNARLKGFNLTGMELDTLTVSRTTLNRIMLNDEIRDAIKYVQAAEWAIVQGALARILGVQQILVGGGVYDSKPEGATAASLSTIWPDKYALLSITPASGSVIQPSLGRTFLWTDDSPENVMVESYEEPQTRSTVYRVRQNTQEAIIEKQFGQLIDVEAAS